MHDFKIIQFGMFCMFKLLKRGFAFAFVNSGWRMAFMEFVGPFSPFKGKQMAKKNP